VGISLIYAVKFVGFFDRSLLLAAHGMSSSMSLSSWLADIKIVVCCSVLSSVLQCVAVC